MGSLSNSSWKWTSAINSSWTPRSVRVANPAPTSWWPIPWKAPARGRSWDRLTDVTRGLAVRTWVAVSSTPWRPLLRSALMANVLLGVTGSVAAIRTPALYEELKRSGHEVKVVATAAALYFFDPAALDPVDPTRPQRNPAVVILDEDEWPGHLAGRRYERADPILHIELRRWAQVFLIATLDAN